MARYQKYHLKWPWTPRQVENLDEMLGEIFKDLTAASVTLAQEVSTPSTGTALAQPFQGIDGVDGEEGPRGPQGPMGPQGLAGYAIRGEDGADGETIPLYGGGVAPLPGTHTYYVADTSGGAVTRLLTFYNGLLVSET